MATASGSRVSTLTAVSSGNSGVFRPVSKTTELFNKANWGKEYALYCPTSIDIKPNDIITIDSVKYGVEGVSFYEDLSGSEENHQKIVITKR
jgi:hypothetical protein